MTPRDPAARAAAALGLSPGATPAELTAAFLRRLPAEGYVPPEAWAAGLNAAAGTGLPVTPAAATDEAARLAEDVGAFAALFWLLPPATRRARWQALTARRPGWPVALRLAALEPGLDVVVKDDPD